MPGRLPQEFFTRDSVAVARALLGQRLVRILDDGTRLSGLIVETEAYLGEKDKAAHTFNGRRTERNASMWLGGGFTYVYFTYGMHHCMNVVASTAEHPVAVLLRGLEPTEGIETMRQMRTAKQRNKGKKSKSQTGTQLLRETNLCSGPAKLCQAMAIDRSLDGNNLVTGRQLYIEKVRSRAFPRQMIHAVPRVGVDYAQEWAAKPLRFYLRGNPHISRP